MGWVEMEWAWEYEFMIMLMGMGFSKFQIQCMREAFLAHKKKLNRCKCSSFSISQRHISTGDPAHRAPPGQNNGCFDHHPALLDLSLPASKGNESSI